MKRLFMLSLLGIWMPFEFEYQFEELCTTMFCCFDGKWMFLYIRELQLPVSFMPENIKWILAEVKAPPLVYDGASLFDDSPYSLQRKVAGWLYGE